MSLRKELIAITKTFETVTYDFVVQVCQFPLGDFAPVLLLLLSPVLVVLVEEVHPRQCQHHKRLHKSRRRQTPRHCRCRCCWRRCSLPSLILSSSPLRTREETNQNIKVSSSMYRSSWPFSPVHTPASLPGSTFKSCKWWMSVFKLRNDPHRTQRTPLANYRCAPSKLAADALAVIARNVHQRHAGR